MTTAQQLLDEVRATSGQRWLLAVTSVVAPALGCAAIGVASGHAAGTATFVVVVLALASAVRPDSHIGILVFGAVIWFWLVRIDEPTTAWSVAVALALLVFHVTTALMSATARGSVLGQVVVLVWLRRSVVVALGTIATWALVLVLDRRHAAGSAPLVLAALVALVAATLVVRARSMP